MPFYSEECFMIYFLFKMITDNIVYILLYNPLALHAATTTAAPWCSYDGASPFAS
jgi:hypothetical protein